MWALGEDQFLRVTHLFATGNKLKNKKWVIYQPSILLSPHCGFNLNPATHKYLWMDRLVLVAHDWSISDFSLIISSIGATSIFSDCHNFFLLCVCVCVCVYHHSSISTLSFPDTITLEDQACWRTIITYPHIINDKWAAACWFNGEVMMKFWFLCYIDILCMHICLKIWLQTHDCSFSLCACSGQRVIVQEKNEEQVVENVVTIQVGWNFKASYLLDKLRNENVGYSWI
jgi:hypothetical protein